MTKKIFLTVIIALSACAFVVSGQTKDDLAKARDAEGKAGKAYQAKDFAGFLQNMIEADRLRPNHPRLMYNLADAQALNKNSDAALSILKRMAEMGFYFEPEKDEDFASIINLAPFAAIKTRFADNKKLIGAAEKAFSLPDKELITESVAYDAKTGRFFVSSIYQRKILVVDKSGKATDFSAAADGLYSVSGMKVDAKRRALWVCTFAGKHMVGFDEKQSGNAAVFKYDLGTGKLLKKYEVSNADGKHNFGDLVLSKNGDVFVSDSSSPVIYRIDAKTDKIEPFVKSDIFFGIQGLDFSPDEKYLFVADYLIGILRVDMKDKSVVQLMPAKDAAVAALGIDGMYFHKGGLVAIQNGMQPHRVVKFTLDPTFSQITGSKTLAANHPDFFDPTLGVFNGDDFYFVANSQWPLIDNKGELQKDKLAEPVILKIKL